LSTQRSPKVTVVGAGIIGAAIAWQLSRQGATVTVLDLGGGATPNSFGWINAVTTDESYFRLRVRAMSSWRSVEKELPGLLVDWTGALRWDAASSEELEASVARLRGWDYEISCVDSAAVTSLEPALASPPALAAYAPADGAVDGGIAARVFLAAAADLGAVVARGTRVLSLKTSADRITGVNTSAGDVLADETVLAAGVANEALAATVGCTIPLASSPALLIVTSPQLRVLRGLVLSPDAYVRQCADGRLIASTDEVEDLDAARCAKAVAKLLHTVQEIFKQPPALELESSVVSQRPNTVDGLPALGRFSGLRGLYIAALHSGITLAPAVSEFAAQEILFDRRDSLLVPFAPDRFIR